MTGGDLTGQLPAALVPHAGAMCLLDEVVSWDETRVSCRTASHRRPGNPLRRDGTLPSLHLLEYAAQATAVHGGLVAGAAGSAAPAKYLAAARDFHLHVDSLDDVSADLRIDAECLLSVGDSVLYRFQVSAGGHLLAAGRLTIVAPAGEAS
jgi:predicted hotdog family 3-hydroxylacyl-ACP dehydratase